MDRSAFRVARPYKRSCEIQALDKVWKKKNGLSRPAINIASRAIKDIVNKLGCSIRVYTTAATVYLRVASNIVRPTPFLDQTAPFIGASCILIASKIQNVHISHEEILEAAHWLMSPYTTLSVEEAESLKQQLIQQEFDICANLAYDLRFLCPHRILVQICKEYKYPKAGAGLAWILLSDMHRTLCPILQPAHTLAIAALTLVSQINGDTQVLPYDSRLYYDPLDIDCVLDELRQFYLNYSTESFLEAEAPGAMAVVLDHLKGCKHLGQWRGSVRKVHPGSRIEDATNCTLRFIPDLKPGMVRELLGSRPQLKIPKPPKVPPVSTRKPEPLESCSSSAHFPRISEPPTVPPTSDPISIEQTRAVTTQKPLPGRPRSLPKRPSYDETILPAGQINSFESRTTIAKRPRHDLAS